MRTAGLRALVVSDLRLFLREPVAAFFTLGYPLLLLAVFGAIYGNKPRREFAGLGTVDVSVPSYMGIIIASTGLLNLAIVMATYRERGVLRRLRVTPLSPFSVLVSQATVNAVVTIIGATLLIIGGRVFFGLRFGGNPTVVLAAFLLSTLSFIALGFVLSNLANTARSAQAIGMVIFYPMIFLSGASIPLAILPASLQAAAHIYPLFYVVDLLGKAWAGAAISTMLVPAGVLTLMLVAAGGLANKTFRWSQ
jgi:ABC-2 type transport system permease protein